MRCSPKSTNGSCKGRAPPHLVFPHLKYSLSCGPSEVKKIHKWNPTAPHDPLSILGRTAPLFNTVWTASLKKIKRCTLFRPK